MALDTSKISLPKNVSTEVLNKVRDTSTIATLSPSTPQLFTDTEFMFFSADAEAEVVAEGGTKGSHEYSTDAIAAKRAKIVTTTRVSSELKWADEDNQLSIISQIQQDQSRAMGRALDYIVYHAVSPKSGLAISDATGLFSDAKVKKVTASDDVVYDLDALFDAVAEEWEINGIAFSRKLASVLRKVRHPTTLERYYGDVPLNLQIGTFEGVSAATSGTVSGRKCKTDPKTLAVCGDFSLIKWGMVRDMTAEVIEYGDPDQTGVDLKAHNQIAYRTEAMLGYCALDPSAFAVLKGDGYDAGKAFSKMVYSVPAVTTPSGGASQGSGGGQESGGDGQEETQAAAKAKKA